MEQVLVKNKSTIFEYLLVILILLAADSIILFSIREFQAALFFFVFTVFHIKKLNYDKQIFFVIGALSLLIIIQGIIWDFSLFTLFTFVTIRVLTPYYAIKLIGVRFFPIAEKTIFVASIIGMFFYLIHAFIPGGENGLYKLADLFSNINPFHQTRPNFFLYTISVNYASPNSNLIRNAGPFHEPGAFATFIILGMVFNTIRNNSILTLRNLIFVIILITTFSTAGYMSLIALIVVYYIFLSKKRVIGIIFMVTLIPLFIYISDLPFMKEKIQDQYQSQTEASLNESTSGRILGARKAIVVLSRYPLTGRGLISASKVKSKKSEESAGYGYMNFFSQLGIFFIFFFLFFFSISLKRIACLLNGKEQYWILLAVTLGINLFGQKFIADSFFIMFFFFGLLPQFSKAHIRNNFYTSNNLDQETNAV